jgi:low temperature requirement protein LtrA
VPFHTPMVSRDPAETHRASTPLELFFDLTFVVAVAQAGSAFQAGLTNGRAGTVIVGYSVVFFAIWWAWMNFTWFASAYDTDDVPYRVAVLVQMAGVLVVAAGIPRALEHRDFAVMVVGYVVMRMAMVGLWLRAAAADPAGRRCALRYAAGITAVQLGWVAWAVVVAGDAKIGVFFALAVAELAIPVFAEAAGRTAWHPGHMAERYGLFTIIVLGESISAGTIAVQAALSTKTGSGHLATVMVGGLLIVFSMWWLYFDMPSEEIAAAVRRSFTTRLNGAFRWGYGHFVVFASVAATGAGLAVSVDQITHHSRLTHLETGFAITVPVALYLSAVWALHAPYKPPSLLRNFGAPAAVIVVLSCSATPQPVLATGIVLSLLLVLTIAGRARATRAVVHVTSASASRS